MSYNQPRILDVINSAGEQVNIDKADIVSLTSGSGDIPITIVLTNGTSVTLAPTDFTELVRKWQA